MGKKNIFLNDKNRQCFLNLLNEIHEKFVVEIPSYCLMDNHYHYHLLLRTPEGNLNEAMKYLGGIYTKRFHRSQKLDGPIFIGGYKAIIIDADNYLLWVSRFIHRNPLEEKNGNKPQKPSMSSCSAFSSSKLPYFTSLRGKNTSMESLIVDI